MFEILIICWIFIGLINIVIADRRDQGYFMAFVLGLLLGLIGTLILFGLPKGFGKLKTKNNTEEKTYEEVSICSTCSYQIFKEQKYCPNCGSLNSTLVTALMGELDKVYKLKVKGKITDEEYETIKKIVMGKINPRGDLNV